MNKEGREAQTESKRERGREAVVVVERDLLCGGRSKALGGRVHKKGRSKGEFRVVTTFGGEKERIEEAGRARRRNHMQRGPRRIQRSPEDAGRQRHSIWRERTTISSERGRRPERGDAAPGLSRPTPTRSSSYQLKGTCASA